jgi:plastocyanin
MSNTATPNRMANWSVRKTLIVAAILSIILGSVAGLGVSTLAHPAPAAQTRVIYLFPIEEPFNDTIAGIPHYVFEPNLIVVNKGDTVLIHFYQYTDEHHSFTLAAPYSKNVTLPAATPLGNPTSIPKMDITFVADTPGLFVYHCIFHPPTMTGTLQVVG